MFNAFQDAEHKPFFLNGSKEKVVLLTHGFPGSAKEMRPIAQVLNDMGWSAQGILLPGFGPEIETLPEKSYEDWLWMVESSLIELKKTFPRILMIGNSMGGALTIQAAAKHGVDGLILSAPFWKINHVLWPLVPIISRLLPMVKPFALYKPDFQDAEFQRGTRNFIPDADFDDPVFQQQLMRFEVHTGIFANIRKAGIEAQKYASQITTPTMIIQGTDDELVTPQTTRKLISEFAGNVHYLEVPGPHNPIQPELPGWDEIVNGVKAFVSSLEDGYPQ